MNAVRAAYIAVLAFAALVFVWSAFAGPLVAAVG